MDYILQGPNKEFSACADNYAPCIATSVGEKSQECNQISSSIFSNLDFCHNYRSVSFVKVWTSNYCHVEVFTNKNQQPSSSVQVHATTILP